jgi:SAM-dependent methyltransferase
LFVDLDSVGQDEAGRRLDAPFGERHEVDRGQEESGPAPAEEVGLLGTVGGSEGDDAAVRKERPGRLQALGEARGGRHPEAPEERHDVDRLAVEAGDRASALLEETESGEREGDAQKENGRLMADRSHGGGLFHALNCRLQPSVPHRHHVTSSQPNSASTPRVDALLAAAGIGRGEVVRTIDERDEMVAFLARMARGDRDRADLAYFQTGLNIASSLLQIVRWRFGSLQKVGSLLDFASGYGRISRFLAREIPPDRLWVSDIYDEALTFQSQHLGVQTLPSSLDPQRFAPAERFDVILVTSLFSHLPTRLFTAWLDALAALLTPGGLLVFSVHGEDILPPGETLPEEGLLFQEISESGSLSTGDYGSTWVSEAFVRRSIEQVARGASWTAHRLRRALCNYQDLWVVVPGEPPAMPLEYRWDPMLAFEELKVLPEGAMRISGWCGTLGGAFPRAVQVQVGDAPAIRFPLEGPRPDVAAQLGQRFESSGWGGLLALQAPLSFTTPLAVSVEDDQGALETVLISTLEGALLDGSRLEVSYLEHVVAAEQASRTAAARQAAAVIAERERQIAWMESSRFWKLRNRWFALKSAFGAGRSNTP